jgi:hypothetical protein
MPHGSPARRRVDSKGCEREKQGEECSSHWIVPNIAAPEIRALTSGVWMRKPLTRDKMVDMINRYMYVPAERA